VQLESHFSVGGPGEEEDARIGVPQPTIASTAQGAQVSSCYNTSAVRQRNNMLRSKVAAVMQRLYLFAYCSSCSKCCCARQGSTALLLLTQTTATTATTFATTNCRRGAHTQWTQPCMPVTEGTCQTEQ
jgi:hypothetical protein